MKKSYKQLSVEEREKISIFRVEMKSIREIGTLLGRSHSSILREIKHNGSQEKGDYYYPNTANERAKKRKSDSVRRNRLKSQEIREYVVTKLKLGWSPEQIAGRISKEVPRVHISHEAIYQYIYLAAPSLKIYLARSHRRRRRKGESKKHQGWHITNRVGIDQRPPSIEERKRFGHWESDSMVSKKSKVSLNVLVERKTRYIQLTKMRDKTSVSTKQAIKKKLRAFHKKARKSITYDNGSENVGHETINKAFNMRSYFCNAYHSWEKGTVENTNGLVRRFFPKGIDIKKIRYSFIKKIEKLLNERPRKCLNYQTPAESFEKFGGALPG